MLQHNRRLLEAIRHKSARKGNMLSEQQRITTRRSQSNKGSRQSHQTSSACMLTMLTSATWRTTHPQSICAKHETHRVRYSTDQTGSDRRRVSDARIAKDNPPPSRSCSPTSRALRPRPPPPRTPPRRPGSRLSRSRPPGTRLARAQRCIDMSAFLVFRVRTTLNPD